MARAFGVLSAVVGAVTGLATIVGALVGHFAEVKQVAVPVVVAIGYLVLSVGLLAAGLVWIWKSYSSRWVRGPLMLIGPLALGFALFGGWGLLFASGEGAKLIFAGLYLAYGLWAATTYVTVMARRAKASRKRCPDCAETVKSAANVCQHCGYRWFPPIPGSAHVAVVFSQPDPPPAH